MKWHARYGWSKPLASRVIDGRQIDLTQVSIVPTYSGLLEGSPNKRLHFNILKRWKDETRNNDATFTQIIPESAKELIDRSSLEECSLPMITFELMLESAPMIDASGAFSWMKVIYFGEKENSLNFDMLLANLDSELDWEKHCKDSWP